MNDPTLMENGKATSNVKAQLGPSLKRKLRPRQESRHSSLVGVLEDQDGPLHLPVPGVRLPAEIENVDDVRMFFDGRMAEGSSSFFSFSFSSSFPLFIHVDCLL